MPFDDDDKQWTLMQGERVEPSLLTALQWASSPEMRQRTHSAALRAIDEELETVQDRVRELEHQ